MVATFRPERFLDESPGVGHASLGSGIGRCLGASLVTFEMGVVVRTVLEAAPALRPAAPRLERVSLHAVTMVLARGARVVLGLSRTPISPGPSATARPATAGAGATGRRRSAAPPPGL